MGDSDAREGIQGANVALNAGEGLALLPSSLRFALGCAKALAKIKTRQRIVVDQPRSCPIKPILKDWDRRGPLPVMARPWLASVENQPAAVVRRCPT